LLLGVLLNEQKPIAALRPISTSSEGSATAAELPRIMSAENGMFHINAAQSIPIHGQGRATGYIRF
jgi:hypothetical protein